MSTQFPSTPNFDLGALFDDNDTKPEQSTEPLRSPKLHKSLHEDSPKSSAGGGDIDLTSRFKPPTSNDVIQKLSAKLLRRTLKGRFSGLLVCLILGDNTV